MKIVNIDVENKTFTTDDGTEYPFMFDVDAAITIEEFQSLIDESEDALKKLLNH